MTAATLCFVDLGEKVINLPRDDLDNFCLRELLLKLESHSKMGGISEIIGWGTKEKGGGYDIRKRVGRESGMSE